MKWTPREIDIKDLKEHSKNPRKISKNDMRELQRSIDKFGLCEFIVCNNDNTIIGGHQRVKALKSKKIKKAWALFPEEELSDVDADELNIRLNKNAGEWDFEVLKDWDQNALLDWGFQPEDFPSVEQIEAEKEDDAEDDKILEPPKEPKTRRGDLIFLGDHRLLCGDSTIPEDVQRLLDGEEPILMVTDPPYGVEYDPSWRNKAGKGKRAAGKVKNDDSHDWAISWSLFPGNVAYVWCASWYLPQVAKSLDDNNFERKSLIIWAKQHFALSRGDYHWQHEPCQPEGTMVSKVLSEGRWKEHSVIEQVPIETLKIGDKVVSFGNAKIFRRGREITRIGFREYTGNMHEISVGDLCTKSTSEHQFTVRMNPDKKDFYLLYLMKRGERWRIGVCKMFNSRGFGLAVRLDQEKGEAAWVLSAFQNKKSACIAEQIATCVYGIPTTHWETDRNDTSENIHRDMDDIDQIYQKIGIDRIRKGVDQAIKNYGLEIEYPLITSEEDGRFSRKQSRIVRACNLVPGIMEVPVPTHGEKFEWLAISSVRFKEEKNVKVWSMDVDQDKHYVADGIVTHNCWYAVRKGQKHNWQGSRKESTIWEIANHNCMGGDKKDDEEKNAHGTQKPIECMARPIRNNSAKGDSIYDPFVGSGTTLIACENLDRRCYAMELDPAYCDIIIERWKKNRERKNESTEYKVVHAQVDTGE